MSNQSSDLRQLFLHYFQRFGHTLVKSSPLVPLNDPTLMFTNAGMVQFKELFVGLERREYTRAATCQKCMRVSGKHNDLEEVGRTARHHTFFEMLGNFSFGDYFKEEAIVRAWDFLTREVGLNPQRLWITVFGGENGVAADDEARALWRAVSGLPEHRILSKGMEDNFWSMGDTGPCGPCTEVYYHQGGEGEATQEDFDNGRVMEIWNNVFMQFERFADGSMVSLPAPSVDTGMGLERLTSVVGGADSNYHTSLFWPVLEHIAEKAGKPYKRSASEDDVSMRVIADHCRATAFLMADGIQPSNEGRGYVLRRIMRRAIRHGKRLGFNDVFFPDVCDLLVKHMGGAYPELLESRSLIGKWVALEETGFRRTLDTGLRLLQEALHTHQASGQLPGDVAFKLYDTYGFPKDLTEVIAQEQGVTVDEKGFTTEMQAQKERSRGHVAGGQAVETVFREMAQQAGGAVSFVGYAHENSNLAMREGSWRQVTHEGVLYVQTQVPVVALAAEGHGVSHIAYGAGYAVFNPTPLYGESGGQVGDQGLVSTQDGTVVAYVRDTQKPLEGLCVAEVEVMGTGLRVGEHVWVGYPVEERLQTRCHHSATHLLHGALREVLGDHVKQAGSWVDPHKLRFDFSHFEPMTLEQWRDVEERVNRVVGMGAAVGTEVLSFDEAKQKGAMALFGEKYGDKVRVVSMGPSVELCGGTHVSNTADISMVLLGRDEAVQSGVRRIEAEAGKAALQKAEEYRAACWAASCLLQGEPGVFEGSSLLSSMLAFVERTVRAYNMSVQAMKDAGAEVVPVSAYVENKTVFANASAQQVRDVCITLMRVSNTRVTEYKDLEQQCPNTALYAGVRALMQRALALKEHERRLQDQTQKTLSQQHASLLDHVQVVGGVRVLACEIPQVDSAALRSLSDFMREKMGSGIVVLGSVLDGKVSLLVSVTPDLTGRWSAGALIKDLAPLIGGRGGGKPEFAQAGGHIPEALNDVFAKVVQILS